jgi:hypothetical protein
MGGNVAMMYAGVRPERIRRLVNLEGFGMPEPPARPGARPLRPVDRRAQGAAPRRDGPQTLRQRRGRGAPADEDQPAPDARQGGLAGPPVGCPDAEGRWTILGDAAHKVVNANLYQLTRRSRCTPASARRCSRWTASDDSLGQWWKGRFTLERVPRAPAACAPAHRGADRQRRPHAAPRPAAGTGPADRKLPGVRKSPVSRAWPAPPTARTPHGSRTHQRHPQSTGRPQRTRGRAPEVSLTTMPRH